MCKCDYGVCDNECVTKVKCRCHVPVELRIPDTLPDIHAAGMVKIPPRKNKAFMAAFNEAFGGMSSVNLEWKCYIIWNAAKKNKKSK